MYVAFHNNQCIRRQFGKKKKRRQFEASLTSEITLNGHHPSTTLSDDQPRVSNLSNNEIYLQRMEFPCMSLATQKEGGNIKRRGVKTAQNSV